MANPHLNPVALAVMYIGFFGWILSALFFILRGFRRSGAVRWRKAVFWFALTFVFLAVWIAGITFLPYLS